MISKKIIEWLNTCPSITMLDMAKTVDDGQGLYKTPGIVIEELVDGSQIRTENYYILFRRASKLKKERLENESVLESLERWIMIQNFEESYPEIGHDVDEVSISNGYYIRDYEHDETTYQATLKIRYYIDIDDLKG